ncbi:hypothetical protein JCM10908_000386 [Rhodotorula pacifica]|uniref:uncharacterized protein n=1 Tax=Rhodotorula pacifica TaxID=1495444 RepID=UPI00317519C8
MSETSETSDTRSVSPTSSDYADFAPSTSKRACLAALPQELLVQILSEPSPPPSILEGPDDDRLLLTHGVVSAMQCCRALLDAGRIALYRRPRNDMAKAAFGLRSTIEANEGIARLVRDLRDLPSFVSSVEGKKAANAAGAGDELQESLLKHCVNLTEATVYSHDQEQAKRVGTLLRALPHLSSLGTSVREPPRDWRVRTDAETNMAVLASCLTELASPSSPADGTPADRTPRLRHLSLYANTHACTGQATCPLSPLLPSLTSGLTLELICCTDIRVLDCFLPRESPSSKASARGLTSLTIIFDPSERELEIASISDYLQGNTLEFFEMHCPEEGCSDSIAMYHRDRPPLVHYGSEMYRLFPNVRHLRLSHGTDMNLVKLALLGASSPKLEYLDLSDTYWDLRAENLDLDAGDCDSIGLSAFEGKLVRILSRFKHLRFIHLGIWPFVHEEHKLVRLHGLGRTALSAWAKERGINLVVTGCGKATEKRWTMEEMAAECELDYYVGEFYDY